MWVCGRSEPRAVSVCQRPFSSSYSMTSVCPGTVCSSAAACAAARASACVGKGSEKTPSTLYAHPPSCSTISYVTCAIGNPLELERCLDNVSLSQPITPATYESRRQRLPPPDSRPWNPAFEAETWRLNAQKARPNRRMTAIPSFAGQLEDGALA